MKKLMGLAGLGAAALLAGCAFNPESMPVTARDNACYVDEGVPKSLAVHEERAKVAVMATSGVKDPLLKSTLESLDSTLNEKLSKFAFFEVVDRKSAAALIADQAASAEDPTEVSVQGVESDFVMVARIASFSTEPVQNMLKVNVQFDFKWISKASQKVIMTESIKPATKLANGPAEVPAVLNRAAEMAAREFCSKISAKYAPPARVLQTRGDGQAARISIGKNYGVTEGADVMFFEIVDNTAVGGEARDQNDIAKGVVKRVEAKTAWVQVDNYEKVNVRKGTYVRVLEKKNTFGSNFLEQSGINEMMGN